MKGMERKTNKGENEKKEAEKDFKAATNNYSHCLLVCQLFSLLFNLII